MRFKIFINNDQLDLFNDETIEINSSVLDINDISKNTTDFTKNFTVPASQKNNIIFSHYYDFEIDNTFDARTKTDARIEIDGVVYRYGRISLLSVKMKQGNPTHYTIVFYGNLVTLKDKLKEDYLDVLDLSTYNHEFNSSNVKTGLTSSLFSGDVVYPLFAKKQYYYNSDSADNTYTESLANIAYNGGSGINGVQWSDLRPSIKLLPIFEAIETRYNILFSKDFLGSTAFTNLYMWVNDSSEKEIAKTALLINWDSGNGGDFGLSNATDTWVNSSSDAQYYEFRLSITPSLGFGTIPYDIVAENNGVEIYRKSATGTITDSFIRVPNGSFSIKFYIKANASIQFSSSVLLRRKTLGLGGIYTTFDRQSFSSANSLIDIFDVALNLPKIKIIDFIKGILQMFKLVVTQENESDTIYINTLNDYYASGKLYDLTKFVDVSENTVERGNLLNVIQYKFEDPVSILNKKFKENVGQGYGDEEAVLENENGDLLDGSKLEIKLPFEQVVYERLPDLFDDTETNIMYGAIIDDKTDPVNIKPHLHYVVNNVVGTKTVSFINASNIEEQLNGSINIPSHTLGFTNPQYSTIFGKEFNEYTKELIENTLYSNYHDDYITSIFNIKRRTFKYNLFQVPYRIMIKLKLNDVVKLRNRYFRISSYTYNLLTNKVQFELVNSFDNKVNGFTASPSTIYTDYTAKTESTFITNLNNFSLIFNDVGFGIGWVSYTSSGSSIYFDIDENGTGSQRIVTATITNTDTLQVVTVTIIQTAIPVTADSSTITADSDTTTADNG